MTKQELLTNLKAMPACFFNMEQTIAMIESIEVESKTAPTEDKYKPLEIGVTLNNLLAAIIAKMDIENKKKSLLDADKNVFGIIANKVYLEDYDLNVNPLLYDIRLAIVEFFDNNDIIMLAEKPTDALSNIDDAAIAPTPNEETDEIYVGDAELRKEQHKWGIN